MPSLHPCGEPSCPTLTHAARCPEHERRFLTTPEHVEVESERQRRQTERRGSATSRGYNSRWTRLALLFRWQHPTCGSRHNGVRPVMSTCFDFGLTTAAEHVDHVVPHKGNQALFWDESNWQSLCASCHAAKSAAGL